MYTCSITNIDLTDKEAVFIPLTKNTNNDDRDTKNIYTVDSDFKPSLLPIFGKFDYDRFQITKDKNTEILEDFFELSIEDIYDTCLSSRSILSSNYSAPFKKYTKHFDTEGIDSANSDFNPNQLLNMNFGYNEKQDIYLYKGDDRVDLKIKFTSADKNDLDDNVLEQYGVITYTLLDGDDNVLATKTTSKLFVMKYLVEDIVKFIGFSYIFAQDKKQNVNLTLSILNDLNGMFISKKVYDILVSNSYSEYGEIKNDNDLNKSFSPEGQDLQLLQNVVGMTSMPKYLFRQINPNTNDETILNFLSNKGFFFDYIKGQLTNQNIPIAMNIVSNFPSIYFNNDMDKELNIMNRLFFNMTYNNYMFRPNVISSEDSTSILISKIAELTVTESFIDLETEE